MVFSLPTKPYSVRSGPVSTAWGSFWVRFGSVLGSFWVRFGSVLGSFWVRSGSVRFGLVFVRFVSVSLSFRFRFAFVFASLSFRFLSLRFGSLRCGAVRFGLFRVEPSLAKCIFEGSYQGRLGVKKVICLIEGARSRFAKLCFLLQREALV